MELCCLESSISQILRGAHCFLAQPLGILDVIGDTDLDHHETELVAFQALTIHDRLIHQCPASTLTSPASVNLPPSLQCPQQPPTSFGFTGAFPGSHNTGGGRDAGRGSHNINPGGAGGPEEIQRQIEKLHSPEGLFGDPNKILVPGTTLACPYRKLYPFDHTASKFPECAVTGFELKENGFTKLKNHIKKFHGATRGYVCSRCGAESDVASEVAHVSPGRPPVCPRKRRKIGAVQAGLLTSRALRLGSDPVKKWISIFSICFPEFEDNAGGITYWHVPVVEHFELQNHLSPPRTDGEACSRLHEVEEHVQNLIDTVDDHSLARLTRIITDTCQNRLAAICSKRCNDPGFTGAVMDGLFYDDFRPRKDDLRTSLMNEQLSLTSASDMYPRISTILFETCKKSAELRNRDSGISVGGGSVLGTPAVSQGASPMDYQYHQEYQTINPQLLNGANHLGIGGTQSSRRA
ncbi:hypothetical protein OQA88_8685 [Cercophora sp. LCS_1]